MSLKLAGQLFTGPFPVDTTEVRANHVPVVYAIIAKGGPPWAPVLRVVDVGSSPQAGIRFAAHPSRGNWITEPGESLGVYLFYTRPSDYSPTDREHLVRQLRCHYDPPKGVVE